MLPFTFRCPVPPSLKNSREMRHPFGRKPFAAKSKAARDAQLWIQRHVERLLHDQGRPAVPFADRNLQVEIVHDVAGDELEVTITDLGPRPTGKTGRKRDLQNMQEALLDALQGTLFDNDNQVDRLVMERFR